MTESLNLDNLTLGQIKQLKCLLGTPVEQCQSTPFVVGVAYLIRTVTMAWTGRAVSIGSHFIVLKEAAWIADTGRFSDFVVKGTANEVEPVPGDVIINLSSIIDALEFKATLPREVK
jgi:hypothetical protein